MFGRRYWSGSYFGPRYWGDGGSGVPVPSGQTPRATRYRLGHRVDWVHHAIWLVLSVGGLA